MSKLSAWCRIKGKPFTIRAKCNGKGTAVVLFYDGYVTIRSVQPGARQFASEIHITRSAWIQLLKAAPAPTRLMEGPDFDRYRAERQYYRHERELLEGLRVEKKERRSGLHQSQRHARAKARAQKKADATD